MFLLLAALAPKTAAAHPHVFIDNRVTVLLADQKIAGFRENWLFDEVFSDQLLQQFDTDQDGAFSAAENQQIAATTLPSLANFHYFTYAWVDGKDLGRLEPSDFHASVLGHRQIAGRLAGGGRLGGLLALLGPILITSIGTILLAGALLDQGPY